MSESQFYAIAPVPNSGTCIGWRIRATLPRSHLNRVAIGATLSAVFPNVAKPTAIFVA
jgi:hypothetical protein